MDGGSLTHTCSECELPRYDVEWNQNFGQFVHPCPFSDLFVFDLCLLTSLLINVASKIASSATKEGDSRSKVSSHVFINDVVSRLRLCDRCYSQSRSTSRSALLPSPYFTKKTTICLSNTKNTVEHCHPIDPNWPKCNLDTRFCGCGCPALSSIELHKRVSQPKQYHMLG